MQTMECEIQNSLEDKIVDTAYVKTQSKTRILDSEMEKLELA